MGCSLGLTLVHDVIGFAVVAGLLTVIPGLDTALVLRATVTRGRRHGVATALGVSTGALLWGAGAAVGVSALLAASADAYTAVRIAGAMYMACLGLKLLIQAFRPGDPEALSTATVRRDARVLGSWARGLWTNVLNPKIGAFYVAVLPQFIPAHASHIAVGLLLAAVHDCEGLIWFTAIILGTHMVRAFMRRRTAHRGIDGLTGAALIGFGVKLSLSGR